MLKVHYSYTSLICDFTLRIILYFIYSFKRNYTFFLYFYVRLLDFKSYCNISFEIFVLLFLFIWYIFLSIWF